METVIVNTRNAKYKVIDIHGNEYEGLNKVVSSKMFDEHFLITGESLLFEKEGKLFHFVTRNVVLVESTGHNFEGYINKK